MAFPLAEINFIPLVNKGRLGKMLFGRIETAEPVSTMNLISLSFMMVATENRFASDVVARSAEAAISFPKWVLVMDWRVD